MAIRLREMDVVSNVPLRVVLGSARVLPVVQRLALCRLSSFSRVLGGYLESFSSLALIFGVVGSL